MSSTPEGLVVSNTSPLLYLHQVGQLDLLQKLYGRLYIPSAVQSELKAGEDLGVTVPDIANLEWIEVRDLDELSPLPMFVDLGSGEAQAIALAASFPGSLLILDDAFGRRIAHLSGVTFTGTLGVLAKAKQLGLLANVRPVVEALQRTTMHLTPQLIALVLAEAGEN